MKEPKFKVGNKIWFLANFQPKSGTILWVFQYNDESYSYKVNESQWIGEHKLYKSKDKMIKINLDHYEQVLAETESIVADLKNALKN
jgi:hypothetical protein